jgi:hypothetical protein
VLSNVVGTDGDVRSRVGLLLVSGGHVKAAG